MSPVASDREPFDVMPMLGPFQPAFAYARGAAERTVSRADSVRARMASCAAAVLHADARRRVAALPAA